MKFGITPISFDVIDESIDIRKIQFPLLVQEAIDRGFKYIEITMDLEYVLPGSLSRKVIKKLAKIKDDTGITYTVHLPLWSTELASPNIHIRDASCKCMIESIERTLPLDPEVFVLHLTGSLAAEFSRLKLSPDVKKTISFLINGFASDSIQKILKRITIPTEKIAIENVEFPFEVTRKLVDKYNLSICFDSGHAIVGYSGDISVQEFLKRHLDKIIEIHLNDGKFVDGRPNDHIAIGDGSFPMDAIEIIRKNFDGPCIFELSFRDAEKSLKVIKEHYPDLF